MPTSRRPAPFGIEVTRGRSQPSRQPTLDVKVCHKIADLELELLNIVRDHYGLHLPIFTPMSITRQAVGNNEHIYQTSSPSSEPCDHRDEFDHHVRKLLRRSSAGSMSHHRVDVVGRRSCQKRTAINLLKIPLPLELRCSGIRPFKRRDTKARLVGKEGEFQRTSASTIRLISRYPEGMAETPQGVRELR